MADRPTPYVQSASDGSAAPAYGRTLIALLAAGIATFSQLYAIQAVLPQMSADWDLAPSQAALTVSFATTGVAAGVFPWAWAADRWGRFRCLRTALILAVVFGTLAAFMPNFESLLVVRFFSGVALAGVPVLTVAYVRELFSGAKAAAVASAYIAGTSAGGAGGRLIAGPLAPVLGWREAVVFVSVLGLLIALLFLLAPRTAPQERKAGVSQARRFLLAISRLALWRLYVQALLVMGGFVAVYNFISFRLQDEPFNLTPAISSLIFITYFAGTVTSRLGGAGLSRLGYARTVFLGIIGMIVGLGITLLPNLLAVFTGLVIFTSAFFLAHAAAVAAAGEAAGPDYRAQASALYTVFYYLGSGVLGWGLGLFFEAWSWTVMSVVIAVVLLLCLGFCTIGTSRRTFYAPR